MLLTHPRKTHEPSNLRETVAQCVLMSPYGAYLGRWSGIANSVFSSVVHRFSFDSVLIEHAFNVGSEESDTPTHLPAVDHAGSTPAMEGAFMHFPVPCGLPLCPPFGGAASSSSKLGEFRVQLSHLFPRWRVLFDRGPYEPNSFVLHASVTSASFCPPLSIPSSGVH